MDKSQIKTPLHAELPRLLHVVGSASPNEEVRTDHSRIRGSTWVELVVTAILVSCIIGFAVSKRHTIAPKRTSPGQEHIAALAKQISSLTQTDLIVFPDGRVWYVRSVRGKNLEVVGWVGDNAKIEDIDSFVLREDKVTIVHHNEAAWSAERDKFLEQ